MTETALCAGTAAVYYHDAGAGTWKPVDGGQSNIGIYHNPATNLYRVVALATDGSAVINSAIFPELVLTKLTPVFFSWADPTITYGVQFIADQEAQDFSATMERSVASLAAPPPATTTSAKSKPGGAFVNELSTAITGGKLKSTPKPAASMAKPTGATPEPKEAPFKLKKAAAVAPASKDKEPAETPIAKPASAKPAGAASGSSSLRGGTEGWSAAAPKNPSAGASIAKPSAAPVGTGSNRLPQQQKPAPVAVADPSKAESNVAAASSGDVGDSDLDGFKQELLQMFRDELERAKQEILEAVRV